MTDITVPVLGESVTEATVGKWLKSAGDQVVRDEVLVELETDKVSVEVSAPEDGILTEIIAMEGATVEIGAMLASLNGKSSAAAAPAPAPVAEAAPAAEPDLRASTIKAEPAPAPAATGGALVDITVPSMGESVAEGTLGPLLKQPGDAVSKDETIVEIETDKVALEVSAPADGVLESWLFAEGDSVTPGAVLGRVSTGASGWRCTRPCCRSRRSIGRNRTPRRTIGSPHCRRSGCRCPIHSRNGQRWPRHQGRRDGLC